MKGNKGKVAPATYGGKDNDAEVLKLMQLGVGAFGDRSAGSGSGPQRKSERFLAIEAKMAEQHNAPPEMLRSQRMALLFSSVVVEGDNDKQVKYVKEQEPPGAWTINPIGNKWCAAFDQVIAVALVWTAIVTPYELAFLGKDAGKFNAMFFLGQAVNLVFIIDLILQFFVHFETITEMGIVMEGNHRKIFNNYFQGNFSMDLISSIPWSIVEMGLPGSSGSLGVLRLLRLLRLLKLLKIMRGSRLIEKYRAEVDFSFANITLYAYIFIILLFAHWVACIWGFTAADSAEVGKGWLLSQDLHDSPPFHQFTVAFYFAVMTITTVGYGDVTPTNQTEYLVVTVVMIIGGFLWAYVIGGICTVVGSMDTDRAKFQSDFDRINYMLRDLGMTRNFSVYVRKYLFNAEEMLRRETYDELVELLTPYQQREVALHRCQANLTVVPYFRDCHPECVTKLYSELKHVTYAPQESMDMPFTLYLISNQGLAVKSGKVYSLGAALNTDFMLDSEELIDVTSTVALTFIQVETLHRDSLNAVLELFPADRAIVRMAKIRISFIRKLVSLARSIKSEERAARLSEKERSESLARSSIDGKAWSPERTDGLKSPKSAKKRLSTREQIEFAAGTSGASMKASASGAGSGDAAWKLDPIPSDSGSVDGQDNGSGGSQAATGPQLGLLQASVGKVEARTARLEEGLVHLSSQLESLTKLIKENAQASGGMSGKKAPAGSAETSLM